MGEYDIGKAFDAIERELMSSMIRNLDRHKAEETDMGIEWTQWQAEQLKSLEQYKVRNQKKYKSRFTDINRQIDVLIRTARESGGMDQEIEILRAIQNGFKRYKKAGDAMTAQFFRTNDRKLDALIKATVDDMKKAETAILRMADDKYRQTIFNAQVYANTGAGTYEKAVDMATKDMLSAGLNCVEYSNGARHTLADYADMAVRTACKRAYLTGEGEKRKEWGISTVIMNKRGNPCPKCLPWVGKIMIDDVWSGGKKSDGSYPLMSTAIAAGLYHPRCRDSHTTYFEGISTPPDNQFTKKEIQEIEKENNKEAERQYAKRQADKFDRMAKYSLDEENRKQYLSRAGDWQNKCLENTHARSVIENIKDYYSERADIKIGDLSRKILDELGLKNIPTNMITMKEWGYCNVYTKDGIMNVVDYNLNRRDARGRCYKIKTAFHEAFHAKANGLKTDYGILPDKAWKDIEETFAESSAHYLAGQMGITDLAPSYSPRLCEMLPRLKQLPEFSSCSTIADFGKIAFNGRMNGEGSEWTDLYNRAMGVSYDWKTYSKQYFSTITANADDYIDKMLENMPDYKWARERMKGELGTAMEKINAGNAGKLTKNENTVIKNVLAVAMNRVGVK